MAGGLSVLTICPTGTGRRPWGRPGCGTAAVALPGRHVGPPLHPGNPGGSGASDPFRLPCQRRLIVLALGTPIIHVRIVS